METRNVEISALRTLRGGFLYLLVAVIVGIVAAFAGLFSFIVAIGSMSMPPHSPFAGVIGAVAILLVLLLVAVGIVLYAVFGKIRPGMRRLSEVDNGFRISYTGTTLMLVGLVIMVLGLIVLVAAFAAVSFSPMRGSVLGGLILALGVLLIGGIIAIIGNILTFVVGAFKLYSRYQNSLYMAAGILFIIDIALILVGFSGILSLVGYILMYIALGDTINKLSTAAATPTQA
ncbi:Phosphoglycerol transferase, alkaline phosphatase superfamily [Pyrobaculum sp. WP30]|nr:Phosphoglycerol transferase, alkaline phosphatase superfamily [Pyrobaculum sp. WP30]